VALVAACGASSATIGGSVEAVAPAESQVAAEVQPVAGLRGDGCVRQPAAHAACGACVRRPAVALSRSQSAALLGYF
jgi:hypothetical protein